MHFGINFFLSFYQNQKLKGASFKLNASNMATEASKPSTRVPYNEADNLVIKAKLKTFEILEVFVFFQLN